MAVQNQQKVPDLVPINGSTNVYVGQRYVPKFYDDGTEQHGSTWDKTQAYEPLTIVLWLGDSYTSRTFVPAGVEITNTQYWLRTGDFNAQLEAYRNEVIHYKEQPVTEILNAKKKTIVVLGDSWSNGYPEVDNTNGWYHYFNENNFKTVYKGLKTGSGYSPTNDRFWWNVLESINITNPNSVDEIFICGGTNDNNQTNLIPRMRLFVSNVRAKYQNAQITNIRFMKPSNLLSLASYGDSTIKSGIKLIDLQYAANYSGPDMWTDSGHPTNKLNQKIAEQINNAIIYGQNQLYDPYRTLSTTLNPKFTGSVTANYTATAGTKWLILNFTALRYSSTISGSINLITFNENCPLAIPSNFVQWTSGLGITDNNERVPINIAFIFGGTATNPAININVVSIGAAANIVGFTCPNTTLLLPGNLF